MIRTVIVENSLLMLLHDFYKQHPGRFMLVMVMLLFAGFVGGFGLATFLPLMEIVIEADASQRSELAQMTVSLLNTLGVDPQLGPLLLIIVAAILVKGLMLLIAMLQTGYTTTQIVTDLRMQLVRSALMARWDFFIERPLGGFANAINSEAVRSSQAFFAAFLVVSDIFQIVIYTALALVISWKVTVAAALTSPVLFFLFHSLATMARRSGRQQTESEKTVLARVTDVLQGIKPIKAMGVQHRLEPLIEHEMTALHSALKLQVFASQTLKTQQEVVIVALVCAGMYLMVIYGDMSSSTLVGLAVLFYRTINQFASVQKRYQLVELNQSAYRSLRGMISEAQQATEVRTDAEVPLRSGPIEFCGVTIKFGQKTILSELNLRLPTKGFVCIVGPSGAGKTTLVDMIAGLYSPTTGEIKVGSQALARLDLTRWRAHIGYVPQEMIMFNDTLRNNLTLGSGEFSEEDLWTALERAGLKNVVETLPELLDTPLGERGIKLSGGQRQRLAIARALIRKPEILILDEVTASLDPATEAAVAATLVSVANTILILAITHQSGLLRYADTILYVHNAQAEMLSPLQATALMPTYAIT